ncbi:NUDIX hydrolase [Frankia sp. KB5]|uniref:NUDIX domain-containing protein n=1 Tax=Frankia sp. KB5 TaxID=683318 RepID=UPI000A113761|nr:NUDIX hydrolase [Frankia sp. KB5]ORT47187.1 hypothetical protein KBI5_21150 [Frankia sp. KB5]
MTSPETARLTADVVALAEQDGAPHVLLIRRGWDPYAGLWALPGGHVDPGETAHAAACRELAEETGLAVTAADLRPIGVYSAPGRDPRGRYVTFAYALILPHPIPPTAGDDATAAEWVPLPVAFARGFAFDHARIVTDAIDLHATERSTPMRIRNIVTGNARVGIQVGVSANNVLTGTYSDGVLTYTCPSCLTEKTHRGKAFVRGIQERCRCGADNDVYA